MNKITNCKTCNSEIASNAKVCPQCGAKNKKPIYKKWWLWSIVALIIIVVAVSGGDVEEQMESPVAESSVSTTSSSTVSKDDKNSDIVEDYKWIGENASTTFNVPEKAIAFMNEHPNFFPGKSEIKGQISDYVNEEVTFAHLCKNAKKYSDKLISISGTVVDIEESDDGSITYIHILDYDNNSYTLYYLGTLDDIFEDSLVYGYALPFDVVTFENQNAQYTEAVVGAACYIEDNGL